MKLGKFEDTNVKYASSKVQSDSWNIRKSQKGLSISTAPCTHREDRIKVIAASL